jgi:hypothetical protein
MQKEQFRTIPAWETTVGIWLKYYRNITPIIGIIFLLRKKGNIQNSGRYNPGKIHRSYTLPVFIGFFRPFGGLPVSNRI